MLVLRENSPTSDIAGRTFDWIRRRFGDDSKQVTEARAIMDAKLQADAA